MTPKVVTLHHVSFRGLILEALPVSGTSFLHTQDATYNQSTALREGSTSPRHGLIGVAVSDTCIGKVLICYPRATAVSSCHYLTSPPMVPADLKDAPIASGKTTTEIGGSWYDAQPQLVLTEKHSSHTAYQPISETSSAFLYLCLRIRMRL